MEQIVLNTESSYDIIEEVNNLYKEKDENLSLKKFKPDVIFERLPGFHSKVNVFYNTMGKLYIAKKKRYEVERKKKFIFMKTEGDIQPTNKSEADILLEGYEEMASMVSELREFERGIASLEELIRSLNSMQYSLKSYIDYLKYRDGIV